jgi:hypothetical protein
MRTLFAVSLLATGIVYAEAPSNQPVEYASRFQVGANYTHASIKIHGQPLFHGNLGGLQGSYEYRPWDRFYGAVRLAWKQGETVGGNQKRDLVYVDVQERLGYTFASNSRRGLLSLFSGLGYRYLSHKLKQHSESNLKFSYNEIYIPVGFLGEC